jgi:hypothetical protein
MTGNGEHSQGIKCRRFARIRQPDHSTGKTHPKNSFSAISDQLLANPKSEYLNPKQIRMFKIQNEKSSMFMKFDIWISILFRIWCLEFRYCILSHASNFRFIINIFSRFTFHYLLLYMLIAFALPSKTKVFAASTAVSKVSSSIFIS